MKIISAKDDTAQACDQHRKHLIFPAGQPDFKPRKLIIPPVGASVATDDTENEDDTLVS